MISANAWSHGSRRSDSGLHHTRTDPNPAYQCFTPKGLPLARAYQPNHSPLTLSSKYSPRETRLPDDGLDPVKEVVVQRHLPAELVVDQLDLDRLLRGRHQRRL